MKAILKQYTPCGRGVQYRSIVDTVYYYLENNRYLFTYKANLIGYNLYKVKPEDNPYNSFNIGINAKIVGDYL